MAFSPQVYGIISQVGERLYERQDKKREKANTWVVGIGVIVATLLTAVTALLESNLAGLPEWLPTVVPILTMLATVFGVSKTKNGVTRSVIDQINSEVARMIDERPGDSGPTAIPEPALPVVDQPAVPLRHDIADTLDDLAKRIAQSRG